MRNSSDTAPRRRNAAVAPSQPRPEQTSNNKAPFRRRHRPAVPPDEQQRMLRAPTRQLWILAVPILLLAAKAFRLLRPEEEEAKSGSRPPIMANNPPRVPLLDRMPSVGLGTMGTTDGENSIVTALESGYRLVDCAPVYFNEVTVGDAIASALRRPSVVVGGRDELFVTSKLASPFHRREHVEVALRKTLTDLGLDYLDLYLIHWPVAFKYVPIDPNVRGWSDESIDDSAGGANIDPSVSVRETWKGMEDLIDKGLVRNIGVSNFPVSLLHELLADCRIKPAVNQVEVHPYLQQSRLIEYCAGRGVAVQAYSPLGTPGYKEKLEPSVLEDPVLAEVASSKGVSVARLCLSWALQRGYSVIAKSVSAERQRQNLLALTNPVRLSEEEMGRIAKLDRGYRFFRPEDWWGAIGAVFD